MKSPTVLYWIRNDLRLHDNLALAAALSTGAALVPVFIWAPEEEGDWSPGGASRLWLAESLSRLSESYVRRNSSLVLREGPTAKSLLALCREMGAVEVFATKCLGPSERAMENTVEATLASEGIQLNLIHDSLLHRPEEIRTGSGGPYQVFTPFYKRCLNEAAAPSPIDAPETIPAPPSWPVSETRESLGLTTGHPWEAKVLAHWEPGEAGAQNLLSTFLDEAADHYTEERDLPAVAGTSRLSPHLHFGEISPRQIIHAVQAHSAAKPTFAPAHGAYIRQVYWRDFAHHLLYHFPHTPEAPLREAFVAFPWEENNDGLQRWQRGQTGYPIVDAGMRELWASGTMHNRVRMIAASFLVKDLRIHWIYGARWFWDTLVDADLANNTMGWQWVAGCGADAAPYFRVFNPMTQGQKFDKDGSYIRKWVPELAPLPDNYIHRPWELSPIELSACGITLGKTYPEPMVDHAEARNEALAAYQVLKQFQPPKK